MSLQPDVPELPNLLDQDLAGATADVGQVVVCDGYDRTIRWRPGERLQHLFEDQCDRIPHRPAVDSGDDVLTYRQLDVRANQLAHHLVARGCRAGDRIGLLCDRAVDTYVGMLAVLKINAAYLPLDPSFPTDRLSFITADAGAALVLTRSPLRNRLSDLAVPLLCLDEIATQVAAEDGQRLAAVERDDPVDELCYLIYTSGSTGRPKGVAVEHASICNFVRVAAEVYGLSEGERVYQGMTIAFDFSVEEIWVPLLAGATLVPKPEGANLLGPELGEFLQTRKITALCCVPTLLATLDQELPSLRFLLVSGEACPHDLVTRWYRPGRRFLNVYGPTEATVTATWTVVHPDRPVTIGVPLPTYSALILDPAQDRMLNRGEVGEIGIAGIGLARGYLNRADLTERAFIPDFIGISPNPSGRIYRTGDLGRINGAGEIEYHGRIDTQVKIRGYRIELTEIESVLLQAPGIAQAVVGTYQPEPGTSELVGYYSRQAGTARVDHEQVYQQLRERLPRYMVPAYLEELPAIPMLSSGKADRKNLPAPRGSRSVAELQRHAPPATATERCLAETLATCLQLAQVSVESHFFDDLGADSLIMAKFCAQVRKRPDVAAVSMRDVYLHPTIRSLAATVAERVLVPADSPMGVLQHGVFKHGVFKPGVSKPGVSKPEVSKTGVAPAEIPQPGTRSDRTGNYLVCGVLQLLAFFGYCSLTAAVLVTGFEWVYAATGWTTVYLRSLGFGVGSFVVLCTVPIAVKWLLVGRWTAQQLPVWGLSYARFWIVKTLIRANPMVLFVGSPLYVLYLKALGARIGRGVAIFSRNVPVCTDLLTIGDGTVIRKDSFFACYRARAGLIETGPVTLGKNVLVGELTVLDIGTTMGDEAQLGHSSSLHTGQQVPPGQRWHGSPAQPTGTDYRAVTPVFCGTLRRVTYSAILLVNRLVLAAPLGIGFGSTLLGYLPGSEYLTPTNWTFYRDQLIISFVLFFGSVLLGLAVVVTVPRLLNLTLRPGRVYPLYGFHYSVHRAITRLTNLKFYTFLFGDSSWIVHYLQRLGYDLSRVEQTGSNFGMAVKHETPFLSCVGSGTMVSDGLSIINADFSSTSFRVSRASIGAHNFLGNNIGYPAGGRTGDDCLLATKVMIPVDGAVRTGVGLLGSPCFEIPRSVQRDSRFDHMKTGDELRRRLAAKNQHNAVTIAAYLFVRWIYFYGVLLLGLITAAHYSWLDAPIIAVGMVGILLFTVVYFVLVERIVTTLWPLRSLFCSIYERSFWQHERYWKVPAISYVGVFNGTPFKNIIWRLLGVRIGRRVFDDGCWMTERSLVALGDGCTLNAACTIQCHSLEDGTFKSDRSTVGAGCTLGVNAFVHYGVTMGDGSTLDADSFLMKGEELAPYATWRGNPATELYALGCENVPPVLPPRSPAENDHAVIIRSGERADRVRR